jgi:urocanate hydratase
MKTQNVVDLWEYLAATPPAERVEIVCGSDQTSLHNPYNGGYYPAGVSFEDANVMMHADPAGFKRAVQAFLHRHIGAIEKVRTSDEMLFFDYENAFLLECHHAGCAVDPSIPS